MSESRLHCPTISPGTVELPPEEAHHARSVLRLQAGQEVILFDGAGTQARARITTISKRQVSVEVGQALRVPFDGRVRLTLAVALPRARRQHFLFEKCTELGVFAIWPVLCDRSVSRPRRQVVEKWRRITIEAAKQSRRAWVPQIESPQAFADTIARASKFDAAVVLDRRGTASTLPELLARHRGCATMAAWIGPEGGFSVGELDAAAAAGVEVARLGATVLRVETAALAVASIVGALTDTDGGLTGAST